MTDRKYLEREPGKAWRVTVNVPLPARAILKKTKLKRSLRTHSLAEANRLKLPVVVEFHSLIDKALGRHKPTQLANDDGVVVAALRLREEFAKLPDGSLDKETLLSHIEDAADELRGDPIDTLADDAGGPDYIYDEDREHRAGRFFSIATGRATPVSLPVDRFLSEGVWKGRTQDDLRRGLSYLESWCEHRSLPCTLESLSRRHAGEFLSALITGFEKPDRRKASNAVETGPISARTANKYLSSLSSYWGWLEAKGYLEHGSNPWKGQWLKERPASDEEKERPFTDDEVIRLFSGQLPRYIRDAMLVGALSGARLDAIISLRVRDIVLFDGTRATTPDLLEGKAFFRFKAQKREKNTRLVPVHSSLTETIARLLKGKADLDDLFPECPPLANGERRERSHNISKLFGYHRRHLGVVDPVAGKRRDRINFHSFRRWFITKAYQSGQPEIVIQMIVGHKPQSVAAGVYLGGLSADQLRACVESVKLPPGCGVPA